MLPHLGRGGSMRHGYRYLIDNLAKCFFNPRELEARAALLYHRPHAGLRHRSHRRTISARAVSFGPQLRAHLHPQSSDLFEVLAAEKLRRQT
jgi:hypothetical protein